MDEVNDSDTEKPDADVSPEDDDQLLLERHIIGRWNATIWMPSPLQNLRNTLLQSLLIKRIESIPLWKVAYAPKQNLLALLTQEGDLEISSVDSQLSLTAKVKVLSDPSTDWCQLEWTASENLLVSSRSNAVLDVFESSANFCYSIPLEGSLTVEFDAMRAVCQLTSRATSGESKWLDELYVLQYNGHLRCFKVGRLSGYYPVFDFNFCEQLSVSLTNTMCLLPVSGLLLVSSPFRVGRDDNDVSGAADVGLSAWRLVDTEPYVVPLPGTLIDASVKAKSNALGGLVGWLPFLSSATSSAIVCMAMNPSQTLLVFVTANGDVGIFQVPSFKPKAFVPHRQSSSKSNNERFDIPVQTLWWSDEEMVILFASGAMKMCSVASVDYLSDQIYQARPLQMFSNCAKLLAPVAGLCFIHECQMASSDQSLDQNVHVSLPNENRIWLAVRMSAVTLYGWLKIAVGAAVGQPYHEVEVPSPEAVASKQVRFLLHEFRQTTPEEMCRKKLEAKRYDEAINLSHKYANIDPSFIYKRQWMDAEQITEKLVVQVLAKVTDVNWAINECLTKLGSSAQSCRVLFKHGIDLCGADSAKIEQRLLLLHYLDVMDDLTALSAVEETGDKDAFDRVAFEQTRNLSAFEMAVRMIESCRFRAFEILATRHAALLRPHWLPLLSRIPEVVDSSSYEFLLPRAKSSSLSWDTSDDSQRYLRDAVIQTKLGDASVQAVIHRLSLNNDLYETEAVLADFRIESPSSISSDLVVRWYRMRAETIEKRTGIPDMLVRFLKVAIEKGITSLNDMLLDAEMFAKYVYSSGDCTRSFAQFQSTPVQAILGNLIREVNADHFASAVHDRIVPYLLHSERFGRCDAKEELFKFLVERSVESLGLVRSFIYSLNTIDSSKTIKLSAGDIIRLIEMCLDASDAVGDRLLLPAAKLLASAPSQEQLNADGFQDAAHLLDTLSVYLEALGTLGVYDLKPSFTKLKAAANDAHEAQRMLTMLIRRARPAEWTVVDWQRMNEDIRELVVKVFRQTSLIDCQELFVRGLLSSADCRTIAYATEFMQIDKNSTASPTKLSFERSVDLALEAIREYTNGASDSRDPVITYAKAVLDAFPRPLPERLGIEHDLILAMALLEDMGVSELPVNVRVVDDKSRVVKRVVEAQPGNYKQFKKCTELARLLRIPKPAGTGLLLCAVEAMRQKDGKVCGKYCDQIVESRFIPGWTVCLEAATSGVIADPHLRLKLYSFALLHCDVDDIVDTLQARTLTKQQAIQKDLNISVVEEMDLASVERTLSALKQLPMDAMYSAANEFELTEETEAANQGLAAMSNLLQLIKLIEAEPGVINRCLQLLGGLLLQSSASAALGCLIPVRDAADTATSMVLRSFEDCPHAPEFVLYMLALMTAAGVSNELIQKTAPRRIIDAVWSRRHRLPPSSALTQFERFVAELKSSLLSHTLTSVSADIDTGRFVKEEDYRYDTILGMALTTNDSEFERCVQLAEQYSVSLWDVKMANLEHLLTDADMTPVDVQQAIKSRRLLETLHSDADRLNATLKTNVWPLIGGRDHRRLLLYYAVVEKTSAGRPEGRDAQLHRGALRIVSKLLPDVDYKQLIAPSSDPYELLAPHLNARNIQPLSSALDKVPSQNISSAVVNGAYARRVFRERLIETGGEAALRACLPQLDHLDAPSFLAFVAFVDSFGELEIPDAERLSLINQLGDYARRHSDRLGSAISQLDRRLTELRALVGDKSAGEETIASGADGNRLSRPPSTPPTDGRRSQTPTFTAPTSSSSSSSFSFGDTDGGRLVQRRRPPNSSNNNN